MSFSISLTHGTAILMLIIVFLAPAIDKILGNATGFDGWIFYAFVFVLILNVCTIMAIINMYSRMNDMKQELTSILNNDE